MYECMGRSRHHRIIMKRLGAHNNHGKSLVRFTLLHLKGKRTDDASWPEKTQKMCQYFHPHTSIGCSINICTKEVFFFFKL